MTQLPLDLHYTKVQGWLDNRSWFFKRRYPTHLKAIQDAARLLLNYAQHDLPALRQQQRAVRDQVRELVAKGSRLSDSLTSGEKAFQLLCVEYGIEGVAVEREIRTAASRVLPGIYAAAQTTCREQLPPAIALYCQYRGRDAQEVLPHLCGDSAPWTTSECGGQSEEALEAPTVVTMPKDVEPAEDEPAPLEMEIDWGDAASSESETLVVHEMEVVSEASDSTNPHDAWRLQFLNEALELQAFLRERLAQQQKMCNHPLSVALPVEPDWPDSDYEQSLQVVGEVVAKLTSKTARHLVLLGTSVRFQDQCIATLRQRLQAVAGCRARLASVQHECREAEATLARLQEEAQGVVERIRATQREVERLISEVSDQCEVHLVGDINML